MRQRRLKNSLFTYTHNSLANVWVPLTILLLDVEPFTKYSPVTLHLSPATRILNENPAIIIIIIIPGDSLLQTYGSPLCIFRSKLRLSGLLDTLTFWFGCRMGPPSYLKVDSPLLYGTESRLISSVIQCALRMPCLYAIVNIWTAKDMFHVHLFLNVDNSNGAQVNQFSVR